MRLEKTYTPSAYESDIYDIWQKTEAFSPKFRFGNHQAYSIVVPPPNANGNLHLGHGLTLALEDIAVRYHRMTGKSALLLPGADHAGFETWVVYEKKLNALNKTRFDFTREELYRQIWDFVDLNKKNFTDQFKKLGASVDWGRYTYTLDEPIVARAHKTFEKMFEEGLIYRAKKLVNFCTFHGTGFADIEVVHKQTKGKLYYISFKLANRDGEVVVATTRPETVVGQAALMVNPLDERYKELIGEIVHQPLVPNVPIQIVAEETIDPSFGTGVVTVTPGHAQVDHDVAIRLSLPIVELITHEGIMSEQVPERFRGFEVEKAKKEIVKALKEVGALKKVEDYEHAVAHCYKCDTVIEPLLREQWFIDMKPLARKAIDALEKNKIIFHPNGKKTQLIQYLKGLKDWNVSRQIAWGIPIPAFQNVEAPEEWIVDGRVECEVIEKEGKTYRRDPDVFDTWFSSSSWPYATMGYPESDDFSTFYPLSVMETGADILYPWVSRMIMFGLYITGEVPFREVYLHGLILDEHGQKMSKSKGNVINPMEKVDLYGSDAFRMGIIMGESAGSNRPYDETKLVGARNFCNKLWNIARFCENALENEATSQKMEKRSIDEWILIKLQQSTTTISKYIEKYQFSEAFDEVYHLVWDDVADWYIEASKAEINGDVLRMVLDIILKLSHPFAPFVTEAIWQTIPWTGDSVLAVQQWPQFSALNTKQAKIAEEFEEIKKVVSEARMIIKALDLNSPHLYFKHSPLLSEYSAVVSRLAKMKGCDEVESGKGLKLTGVSIDCWLDVDMNAAKKYIVALEAQKHIQQATRDNLTLRLSNVAYTKKAPKELVDASRKELSDVEMKLEKIAQEIEVFERLL